MGESKKVIRKTNLLWKTIIKSYERQVKYKNYLEKSKIILIMYIFVYDDQYIVVKLPNHLKM
jgi:hypothetical protein